MRNEIKRKMKRKWSQYVTIENDLNEENQQPNIAIAGKLLLLQWLKFLQ